MYNRVSTDAGQVPCRRSCSGKQQQAACFTPATQASRRVRERATASLFPYKRSCLQTRSHALGPYPKSIGGMNSHSNNLPEFEDLVDFFLLHGQSA